jgi:long-chain acyl-CoA synthetase
MDKFWLKEYPAGVPAEIDWTQYRSLPALLEEAMRTYRDRKAYTCMDVSMTFGELDERSKALGAWLQGKGLAKGARVAIMMPNLLQYPIAIAGILRAGYTVVNVNPLYTPRELEHQLKDSGAEAIIILENFATTLQQVLPRTPIKHIVVASMGDLLGFWKGQLINFAVRAVKKMVPEFELPNAIRFNHMMDEGEKLTLKAVELTPDDVAFLQYTGGTTGVSKGATLLHRNVIANILQNEAWLSPMLNKVGDKQMVVVCALPLYHIFALTACAMMGARLGSVNLLIPNPRDIPGFIKTLEKHKVHFFPAVNTLFNALVNHGDFKNIDFSELKISNGGGMAVTRATAEKWFAATGCPIVQGYGLSETSPAAVVDRPDLTEFTNTIGLPIPSTEIAILDDEGQPVPVGERGEIAIRGPQVMAGYWQRPEETAKVMTTDGYFKSGDIGIMDSRGYIQIVDRKKDMVIVSGFNVYPNEVEEVVSSCPGVLECAVIGVPDAYSGEAVKVFVVKKDAALTERDVMDYCVRNLTGYKKPKHIEFRTDLPKSNVGKILRRELRDEALKKKAA